MKRWVSLCGACLLLCVGTAQDVLARGGGRRVVTRSPAGFHTVRTIPGGVLVHTPAIGRPVFHTGPLVRSYRVPTWHHVATPGVVVHPPVVRPGVWVGLPRVGRQAWSNAFFRP